LSTVTDKKLLVVNGNSY